MCLYYSLVLLSIILTVATFTLRFTFTFSSCVDRSWSWFSSSRHWSIAITVGYEGKNSPVMKAVEVPGVEHQAAALAQAVRGRGSAPLGEPVVPEESTT